MGIASEESSGSSATISPSATTMSGAYQLFRWLFIIGLVSMVFRVLGLWGNSDIAEIVGAIRKNDPGPVIYDILTDGVFIGVLMYALLRPRRPAFVLGASQIFFLYWLGVILIATGVSKGNLAGALSFLTDVKTAKGISILIASVFALFGFLAVPQPGLGREDSRLKQLRLMEIAVPVAAGILLMLVPTQRLTGSTPFNSTDLRGFGVEVFVAGGILAAASGFLRRPSVNLFWGVMMAMSLLESWLGVTHLHNATKPSLWPGIGMIIGIAGCLLLLFSAQAARLATRLLFARRPVITESE